jgi:plastocyanin
MKTTLFLVSLLAGAAAEAPVEHEALDLEVVVEGGRRELFPLLPGTKCPTGHRCRARVGHMGHNRESVVPMMASLHDNMKNPLAVAEEQALNQAVNTILEDGNDYCARRSALSRALGLAAGLAFSTVSNPAFAASAATVKMGDDSGQLIFVPKNTKICKGDSVTWVINKAGPHNVVFDEEAVPAGVKVEDISMDGQIGEEGDTYVQKFDVAGKYAYFCEPHRSAGMNGNLEVA